MGCRNQHRPIPLKNRAQRVRRPKIDAKNRHTVPMESESHGQSKNCFIAHAKLPPCPARCGPTRRETSRSPWLEGQSLRTSPSTD